MSSPWYRDGLRFTCTGCGDCCSGEPGFVWVDEQEIAAMASHLQVSISEFERQFVRQEREGKSLVEYPDGDCIFLEPETRKCIVYAARPTQCRTWPFWNSNLQSKRTWRETCKVCPGSGEGQLYSLEEIETERKKKDV